MQFDQLLDNGQPQPESPVSTRGRRISLLKPVENIRQKLGCDAFTGINHIDFHLGTDAFESYLDLSAFGRELNGVVKDVPKNLSQAIRVSGDRSGKGIDHGLQSNAFRLRRHAKCLDGLVQDSGKIGLLHLQANLARDDSTHIEQIFNNLGLNAGVSFDGFEPLFELLTLDVSALENVGPTQHGIQRGPKLVAQRRQKFVFDSVRALGL